MSQWWNSVRSKEKRILLVATISGDRAIVCFATKDRTRGNCTKDKGCKESKSVIVAIGVAQFR